MAKLQVFVYSNGGNASVIAPPVVYGRWCYLAVEGAWNGSKAEITVYLDGVSLGTVSSMGSATQRQPESLRAGNSTTSYDVDALAYLDEFKLATSYPEPHVPTPADEYPLAARTVVLWNGASDDSRQFADYCVDQLGVPRANLIRLDGAAATEVIADQAACLAQIETPIADYFTLHPTVAGNCMGFLLGYGVPGYFPEAGVVHSITSRLMNYGNSFSSQTDNPLYAPSPVARLTKSHLDAAGVRLAVRVDADSLTHAKDILDAGAVVSALPELADTDTLYTDGADFRSSVACQRLRMLTAALGEYADDAFIWGAAGDPELGDPGSRVCFAHTAADTADTLRSTASAVGRKLISHGYAAALGSSDSADGFDIDSFFEMLRIGGTIAEAFAVAIEHLDYTSVACGSGLMTVAFQRDGYNVYRGAGGIENVDFAAPVACLRPEQTQPLLAGLGHGPLTEHTYVVRPVRGPSGLETPDFSCRVSLRTDAAGDWPGPVPGPVEAVRARGVSGGKLQVRWEYRTPCGAPPASEFRVYCNPWPDPVGGSPQATVDYTGDGACSATVTLTAGATYYVAVTARSAGGVESPAPEVAGPVVAPGGAPPAPAVLVGPTF